MPSLFAWEEALWLSAVSNVAQVLLLVGGILAWLLGWRRKNGWHPPADRRTGHERRRHRGDPGDVSQAREDETQPGP